MEPSILRIGSRKSRLAQIQAAEIADLLRRRHPDLQVQLITMDTTGDRLKDQPLAAVGGKGLFTRELEQALRAGRIDLGVHSLKDMPDQLPEDLPILAYSHREDPRDALVLPRGARFGGLEQLAGAARPIGCSSARRAVQLKRLCPRLRIAPIRGNVPTRLQKLDAGEFSALVFAAAGLNRLCLQERITSLFSPEELLPAAGQGILAVQGRRGFCPSLLAQLDDAESRIAAEAERTVLTALHCGCSSPTAVYCQLLDMQVRLRAFYCDPQTHKQVFGERIGARAAANQLAAQLAAALQKEAAL